MLMFVVLVAFGTHQSVTVIQGDSVGRLSSLSHEKKIMAATADALCIIQAV